MTIYYLLMGLFFYVRSRLYNSPKTFSTEDFIPSFQFSIAAGKKLIVSNNH